MTSYDLGISKCVYISYIQIILSLVKFVEKCRLHSQKPMQCEDDLSRQSLQKTICSLIYFKQFCISVSRTYLFVFTLKKTKFKKNGSDSVASLQNPNVYSQNTYLQIVFNNNFCEMLSSFSKKNKVLNFGF